MGDRNETFLPDADAVGGGDYFEDIGGLTWMETKLLDGF